MKFSYISIIAFFTAFMARKFGQAVGMSVNLQQQIVFLGIFMTCFLSGVPQFVDLIHHISMGELDTHVLMSFAVVGAFYMGMHFEGTLLLLLFQTSHNLEHNFRYKASDNFNSLVDSIPSEAYLVKLSESGIPDTQNSQKVLAKDIKIGDLVIVRPGDQVPIDGRVIFGTASLSLQHISGESLPVRTQKGMEVYAGSVDYDGVLIIRAESTVATSTPVKIAELAKQASLFKPQVERFIDRISSRWSKIVLLSTIVMLVILPIFLGVPFWGDRGALYRAMGVLTAAAPCAMVVAPLAYTCAIATVTKCGILLKGGTVFDQLQDVSVVALDKTGTLTVGQLQCTQVDQVYQSHTESDNAITQDPDSVFNIHLDEQGGPTSLENERRAVKAAYLLSSLSRHPVSLAVTSYYDKLGVSIEENNYTKSIVLQDFKQKPGLGVIGSVNRSQLFNTHHTNHNNHTHNTHHTQHTQHTQYTQEQDDQDQRSNQAHQQSLQSQLQKKSQRKIENRLNSLDHTLQSEHHHQEVGHMSTTVATTSANGPMHSGIEKEVTVALLFGALDLVEPYLNSSQIKILQGSLSQNKQPLHSVLIEIPLTRRIQSNSTIDRNLSNYELQKNLQQYKENPENFEILQDKQSVPQNHSTMHSNGNPMSKFEKHSTYNIKSNYNSNNDNNSDQVQMGNSYSFQQGQGRNQLLQERSAGSKVSGEESVVSSMSVFWFQDELDSSSKAAVEMLKIGAWRHLDEEGNVMPNRAPKRFRKNGVGMQVVMLTGDNEKSAKAIAAEVGILKIRSNLRPEDKLKFVRKLQTTLNTKLKRINASLFSSLDRHFQEPKESIDHGHTHHHDNQDKVAQKGHDHGHGHDHEHDRKLEHDSFDKSLSYKHDIDRKQEHNLNTNIENRKSTQYDRVGDLSQDFLNSKESTHSQEQQYKNGSKTDQQQGQEHIEDQLKRSIRDTVLNDAEQQHYHGVVMVGDGINDAPALVQANVGVAISLNAQEASASVADVVLLNNARIINIPFLLHIANKTRQIVKQNVILAAVSVVVAALPSVLGQIPLWMAVFLHEGATMLVCLNSLRLLLGQKQYKYLQNQYTKKLISTQKQQNYEQSKNNEQEQVGG